MKKILWTYHCKGLIRLKLFQLVVPMIPVDSPTVADPGGGARGPCPPGPVKIGHKKDGRQRRPHRFHVSRPPPLTRPLDPLLTYDIICMKLYRLEDPFQDTSQSRNKNIDPIT